MRARNQMNSFNYAMNTKYIHKIWFWIGFPNIYSVQISQTHENEKGGGGNDTREQNSIDSTMENVI